MKILKTKIMNRVRALLTVMAVLISGVPILGQDVRTVETKVADLLARLPAESMELTSQLMEEMYSLGDEGRAMSYNFV